MKQPSQLATQLLQAITHVDLHTTTDLQEQFNQAHKETLAALQKYSDAVHAVAHLGEAYRQALMREDAILDQIAAFGKQAGHA